MLPVLLPHYVNVAVEAASFDGGLAEYLLVRSQVRLRPGLRNRLLLDHLLRRLQWKSLLDHSLVHLDDLIRGSGGVLGLRLGLLVLLWSIIGRKAFDVPVLTGYLLDERG